MTEQGHLLEIPGRNGLDRLSIIYIVDLGKVEWQSILLGCSLLNAFDRTHVDIIAYAPQDRRDLLDPHVVEFHKRNNIEIRTFSRVNPFVPTYPHGNKILAAAEDRSAPNTLLLDTDTLMVNSFDPIEKFAHPKIFGRRAPALPWSRRLDGWQKIFNHFGLDLDVILKLHDQRLPYLNGGVLAFREKTIDDQHFGRLWFDTALEIDRKIDVPAKRPWLDQVSFTIASLLSGHEIETLPNVWNMTVNGRVRPETVNLDCFILHYHGGIRPRNLVNAGLQPYCGILLAEFSDFKEFKDFRTYFLNKYPQNPYPKTELGWDTDI